ncbi:chemotaxis protein CheY [Candidatus Thiomargarita nelsonii]|uniref:Chemotaxis protein CheY n=1 Tax=Candidatus Thiomargarita nelsonii TaxID=1003181 RepID=A0A0A6P6G6_9GAMM|nr:chemotaxis protein CheY [Candidatus Thiomargarita nelsonii]
MPIILCVDDEKIILESLKQHLRQAFGKTYRYEFAESAEEAMELIEEFNEAIRVIISDWLMPGKKGDEFLIEVHKHYPQIVKIMLTGQADDAAVERAKKQANLHRCLAKPWHETEFVEALTSGLESTSRL